MMQTQAHHDLASNCRPSQSGGGHIAAGRNLQLTAAAERSEIDSASHSKRHTESRHSFDERLIGTSLSANADLTLNAGQDLKLQASAVSLTQGAATFVADRDIKIQSAQARHETDNFHAAKVMNSAQDSLAKHLQGAGLKEANAEATSQLIAHFASAGLGAMASGGSTAGAAMSFNIDANNRQLHPTEIQRIKKLAGGDAQKEARLSAAACALVHCYAEYPEGSVSYQQLRQLAALGASEALAAERQQLRQQEGLFGYSTTGLWSDARKDATRQLNNTYQLTTRALGAGQAVLGGLGVAASTAAAPVACPTVLGCAAVTVSGAMSADAAYAGTRQLVSGNPEDTFTNSGLQSLGLSPQAAGLVEMALGAGSAMRVGAVTFGIASREAAINELSAASYKNFVTHGVKPTSEVMQTREVQLLIKEIQAGSPGISQLEATYYARRIVQSGEVPLRQAIPAPGSTLLKAVPKGEGVTSTTAFWLSPQQGRAAAIMSTEDMVKVLGLPANQAAKMLTNGVDFYAIAPKAGLKPTFFVSDIAEVTQGTIRWPGGKPQVIVPNRSQWSDPVRVDPFTLKPLGE